MTTGKLPLTTDWHEKGLYAVLDKKGDVIIETVSTDAYGARATMMRELNKAWSRAKADGCTMGKFALVGQVVDTRDVPAADSPEAAQLPGIDTQMFILPSGNVAGISSLSIPSARKALAKVSFLTDKPASISLSLPATASVGEVELYARALLAFAQEVRLKDKQAVSA